MTARAVGPVEQHLAGHRAAESYLTTLIAGGCPRGDELFAGLRAVELAHGDEGTRAYLRRVQKALEAAYADCVPPGADPRGALYPTGGDDAQF